MGCGNPFVCRATDERQSVPVQGIVGRSPLKRYISECSSCCLRVSIGAVCRPSPGCSSASVQFAVLRTAGERASAVWIDSSSAVPAAPRSHRRKPVGHCPHGPSYPIPSSAVGKSGGTASASGGGGIELITSAMLCRFALHDDGLTSRRFRLRTIVLNVGDVRCLTLPLSIYLQRGRTPHLRSHSHGLRR